MKSVNWWMVAGLAVLASGIGGCGTGTEATKTAEECTEIELKGVCPAGTAPRLDAAATAQCDTSGEASGSQGATGDVAGSASLDQVCRSTGGCSVLCKVTQECLFGVKAITATEVVCAAKEDANACGDGICLGDEDPVSCAKDCERECDVSDTSCDGVKLRTCSPKGLWSSADCEPGTECAVEDGVAACRLLRAVCEPGKTQCSGDAKETCTDLGQWGASVPCPSGQTCNQGVTAQCVSTCEPGLTACNGVALRTCSPQGAWVEAACPAGTQCTAEGAPAAACTPIPAVCSPEDTRCDGDAVQTCNDLGQWGEAVGCPAAQACDPEAHECVNTGPSPACNQFCTSCFVSHSEVALTWLVNGAEVAVNSYETCVEYVCGDDDPTVGPWIDCCNAVIAEQGGLCRGRDLDEACP